MGRDSTENMQAFLELLPDGTVVADHEGRIVYINTQVEAMFGYAKNELVGQPVEALVPERFKKRHVEHRAGYTAQPKKRAMGQGLELWARRKDGSEFSVDITLAPLQVGGHPLALSIIRDMTERREGERRLAAQHAVIHILVESSGFEEATPKIIQEINEALGWDVGAIWLIDQAANALRCAGVWHQPALHVSEFEQVCRTITFQSGIGLPGRVWASGAPAWIPDVQQDTNFPRAPYAATSGLHAAFGFPIMIQEEVFGMIEFFSREIREPDEGLLRMLSTIGSQIGLFIQRKQAEEAVRQEKRQLEKMNKVMMDREARVLELKREVNELLRELGRPPHYGAR